MKKMKKNELNSRQWFLLYDSIKELERNKLYPIKNIPKEDYSDLLIKLRENCAFQWNEENKKVNQNVKSKAK